MKSGIYIIKNSINNNCYIGKSNNINRRFLEHRTINHESNPSLRLAYKKYGIKNFRFEILEECEIENLNEREIYWIAKLKPKYNRTIGGDGATGYKLSDELKNFLKNKGKEFWNNLDKDKQKEIISKNLTGPSKGHKVSEQTKEKLRLANLNKKQSLETIFKRKTTIIDKKRNGYI